MSNARVLMMQDPASTGIVSQLLALRASHSRAPARDVFDLVMQGRVGQVLVFGAELEPSAPVGQLLAEAFDECMSPAEWSAFTGPGAQPALRAGCLQIWQTYVLPRFEARYGVRVK
jgi:hypothetical protein